MRKRTSGLALVLGGLCSILASSVQAAYTVVPLWGLYDSSRTVATAINNVGQVGGSTETATGLSVPTVHNGSVPVAMTVPTSNWGYVTDLNDVGQALGGYQGARAIWNSSTGALVTTLNSPGNDAEGAMYLNAINNSGYVAGAFRLNSGASTAYIWKDANPTPLATLINQTTSNAIDINSSGLVVGAASTLTTAGNNMAVFWDATGIHTLGALSGQVSSSAVAVNDNGQVVGSSTNANGVNQAVLWNDGTPTILKPLNGSQGGFATGISKSGQIIGVSVDGFGNWSPTVWIKDASFKPNSVLRQIYLDAGWDLSYVAVKPNSFLSQADLAAGWDLSYVEDINDNGDMVVSAGNNNLHYYGSVLLSTTATSSVPEVGTLFSMGIGMLALMAIGRRRQTGLVGHS